MKALMEMCGYNYSTGTLVNMPAWFKSPDIYLQVTIKQNVYESDPYLFSW